jgi:hypothetical protein
VCELTFFGLRISKDGVAIGDDKVQAMTEAGNPNNASELRSFLSLAVYCNTHIPDLATLSEPLWGLLKDNVSFVWGFQGNKGKTSHNGIEFF